MGTQQIVTEAVADVPQSHEVLLEIGSKVHLAAKLHLL